jgi:hypothetical protein
MSAPPSAGTLPVVPVGLAEGRLGSWNGTAGPAQRHAARHRKAGKKRPLTVIQRMPPRGTPQPGPGNRIAVITPTGSVVLSVRIAERLTCVVRLPREAHPRSPERAVAC